MLCLASRSTFPFAQLQSEQTLSPLSSKQYVLLSAGNSTSLFALSTDVTMALQGSDTSSTKMITQNRSRAFIFATVVLSIAMLLDATPMFAQAQSIAASEAATSIAKAKLEAATTAQSAGKKKYPVTRADMVVAMPVDQAHLTVAHASRVWRKVLTLLPTAFAAHVAASFINACIHSQATFSHAL